MAGRRSQFSNGVLMRRIRPRMGKEAGLLDTFVCLDVYCNRHLTNLPPLPAAPTVRGAAAPVHRAFFLSIKPERHGAYAFLGEDRITAIAKATLAEAGVNAITYQAHALRGETLSKLRALGWPSAELLPLSQHSTVKRLERSYFRRALPSACTPSRSLERATSRRRRCGSRSDWASGSLFLASA